MKTQRNRHRDHLRLIPTDRDSLPAILTDSAARQQFEQLTQALVDAAIEIMDLADGNPDFELGGDEFEDAEGF